MERENQYIIHTVKQNDTPSLSDITIIINNNLNKLISTTTIWQWWSKAGLDSYIAVQKLGLSIKNVAKRLAWAEKYKN